jgi:novobiocin biosynthesis protein NovU/D-mycarose 3-C-methyltransferase
MYKPHLRCRACGYGPKLGAEGTKTGGNNERLIPVFDLGVQPLANDFRNEREERAGYAPLKVMFCPRCTLAQLSVVVRPEILYANYSYVTSPSETMRNHFTELTKALLSEITFTSALEIGSNDGAYLEYLSSKGGIVTCGIDPADNLAHIAREKGIPTITGTFRRESAERSLKVCKTGYDLIVARHVFCHVDDWRQFIDDLAIPSHKETLVAIEVPYVLDLLERGEFDTIYHEHLSYLSLKSFTALLADSPWQLHKVLRFAIHGGATLLLLRRKDYGQPPDPGVAIQLGMEQEILKIEKWQEFSERAHSNMVALKDFVADARKRGKTVAAMGASAKSTVWINACGFTRKDIAFITDTTPQKQWKLSPESDIPIVDEGAILRELPDYLICCCWNFGAEVIAKNQLAISKGVHIVFPVPKLEIVGKEISCKTEQTGALCATGV